MVQLGEIASSPAKASACHTEYQPQKCKQKAGPVHTAQEIPGETGYKAGQPSQESLSQSPSELSCKRLPLAPGTKMRTCWNN